MSSSELASAAVLSSAVSTITSSTTSIAVTAATSTTTNTVPTMLAKVFPGDAKYSYYGCWNETIYVNGTGGKRALDGGSNEALDDMTVSTCLTFCNNGSFTFAGLEYGRECWCSPYLSAFATHLPDEECDLPCAGDSGHICGGSWKLTLYQRNSTAGSSRAAVSKNVPTRLFIVGLAVLGMVIELS